jgi:hypothetical protein
MDVQAWLRTVGSSDKRFGVVKDGWKFHKRLGVVRDNKWTFRRGEGRLEVPINIWSWLRTVGSSDKRLGVVRDDWNGQIGNVRMDVQEWPDRKRADGRSGVFRGRSG